MAKLVNITPMSLWFMVLITIATGANLNQLITGGPHIVKYVAQQALFWGFVITSLDDASDCVSDSVKILGESGAMDLNGLDF